jgi:pimeloyl-ACP methyl ester carboxylesterase
VVAALPATRVVLLEDAGHCAHLDEPAEVARILDAA